MIFHFAHNFTQTPHNCRTKKFWMLYNRIIGGNNGFFWFPLYFLEAGMCKEELKLISYGFPLSEAVGMVARLRRDGVLEEFIEEQDRLYREECEKLAREAVG